MKCTYDKRIVCIVGLLVICSIVFLAGCTKTSTETPLGKEATQPAGTELQKKPVTEPEPLEPEPVAPEPQPPEPPEPVEIESKYSDWISAKEKLDEIEKMANEHDPGAHLIGVGDIYSTDCDAEGISSTWEYTYYNPSKEEDPAFIIRADNKNLRLTDNLLVFGVLEPMDKGDLVQYWQKDSTDIYRIYWENGGKIRSNHFKPTHVSYSLAYDITSEQPKAVWKATFHYDHVLLEKGDLPIHNKYLLPDYLEYEIDATTGEIIKMTECGDYSQAECT